MYSNPKKNKEYQERVNYFPEWKKECDIKGIKKDRAKTIHQITSALPLPPSKKKPPIPTKNTPTKMTEKKGEEKGFKILIWYWNAKYQKGKVFLSYVFNTNLGPKPGECVSLIKRELYIYGKKTLRFHCYDGHKALARKELQRDGLRIFNDHDDYDYLDGQTYFRFLVEFCLSSSKVVYLLMQYGRPILLLHCHKS